MSETNHRHEWETPYGYSGCLHCDAVLSQAEVEQRLNNYEELLKFVIEQVGIEHVPKEWGGELE